MSARVETAEARDRVLAIIKDEHRALGRVLSALQRFAHDVRDGNAQCDFALLCAMLYYIDTFPERLHHPKEEAYLFAPLRRQGGAIEQVLERLEGEHARSEQLVRDLEQALVHFQGGAPEGIERLCAAVDAYCEFMWAHMRTEEERVLPALGEALADEDWRAARDAFCDNADPLFGEQPAHAFRRLHQRIANLVPRKMRSMMREGGAPDAAGGR